MAKQKPIYRVKISVAEYGESGDSGHVFEIIHTDWTGPAVNTCDTAEFRAGLAIQTYLKTWHPKMLAKMQRKRKR